MAYLVTPAVLFCQTETASYYADSIAERLYRGYLILNGPAVIATAKKAIDLYLDEGAMRWIASRGQELTLYNEILAYHPECSLVIREAEQLGDTYHPREAFTVREMVIPKGGLACSSDNMPSLEDLRALFLHRPLDFAQTLGVVRRYLRMDRELIGYSILNREAYDKAYAEDRPIDGSVITPLSTLLLKLSETQPKTAICSPAELKPY